MLVIKNLSKSFGNHTVLNDINIHFPKGDIYGIIGSNGAGKSTFFRCICGLNAYQGEIQTDSDETIRNSIAYLPTEPYFYPKITGKEYLEFFRKIADKSTSKFSDELIDLFNLPLNNYIEKYSTGMKKKIAFLAILLLDRPIYILDEPFNGLDLDAVILFKKIILKLKNKDTIILISSHIINSLTDICQQIHYLNNGNFVNSYTSTDFKNIEKDISNTIDLTNINL